MNPRIGSIVLAIGVAACGNSTGIGNVDSRSGGGTLETIPAPVNGVGVNNGTVTMDIPVDVVVVGFPRETAYQLAATLTPTSMEQIPYSDTRITASSNFSPGRFAPRAVFQVTYAPQSIADGYRSALRVAADGEHSDGNTAEAWLQQALAGAGFVANPARPALVLLHQGADSPGYSYEYGNGFIAPVRVLGKGNLAIMDLSAEADPFVGSAQSYGAPLALDDPDLVEKLRAATLDATAYRLMQGPIYLPSLKTCHALTIIEAHRATATDTGGFEMDGDRIRNVFETLTGDPVFVDIKTLSLPMDDPVLDAFSRGMSDSNVVGVNVTDGVGTSTLEQLSREWAEANWSSYHVPHEGCEEYLMIVILGDAADVNASGRAEFDDGNGHRFAYGVNSLSLCPIFEALPVDPGLLTCDAGVGRAEYRVPDFFATHEPGHLFGLRHPHDIETPDGGHGNFTFSSLLTAMSYLPLDRVLTFGAIDVNNFQRNRAATALWMAERAGHAGEAPFNAALQAMQEYRWNDVTNLLRGLDLTPLPTSSTSGTCTFMPPGTTVTAIPDPNCAGCTSSDEALAADASFDTYATLGPSLTSGGGTLRATAPAGTVLEAGGIAGAFIDRPEMAHFQLYVRTYLDDQLQEDVEMLYGELGSPLDHYFYGFATSLPFDAVEFSLHMTGGSGDVHVEEFCSDSGS